MFCAEAAAELLIGHRCWLVRDDFVTRFVEVVPGLAGDGMMALVDWEAALTAADAGRLFCSASEEQVLRIAASLAAGAPVDLRSVLTGLDPSNVALVAAALRYAGGGGTAGALKGQAPEVAPAGTVSAQVPSRNDGVTVPCPVCGAPVAPNGRRRYCSDACRQAGHRRRHDRPSGPPELPPRRARRPVTVYVCPACDGRYLGSQRCPECNLFCAAAGTGGCCPECDSPVAYKELTCD